MNNHTNNSSSLTRGLKFMNLKFWGGWFLAIACVCIFLTMGCENGSLGVKYATVHGRLVNKDNVSMGIPNATVRMLSKEAVSGGGELEQGYNFLATVTDANGDFLFEKVHPDNVIFEFTAPGYRKMVFPSTNTSSSEEDGSTSESADIESVTVSSGAFVDLANIMMEKVSVVLPDRIKVQIDFVDATTKESIKDNISLTVSFDGVDKKDNAKIWREYGAEDIMGANEINVNIRDIKNQDGIVIYKPIDTKITGTSNQYVTIELEPVTYSLDFQFLNVPSYILSSEKNKPIMTILVEDVSTIPYQSISITDVSNFGQLTHLDIPAVKNPQRVRIRMNGYKDEVISLTTDLLAGEKGFYRLDIDFQWDDGHVDDDPVTASLNNGRVGMLDNVITRDIKVNMIGLAQNDKAKIVTNFVPGSKTTYSPSFVASTETIGLADAQGAITAYLNKSPTYFDMTYSIIVYPDNPASSSYIINSGDNVVPIGIPEENHPTEINVDISKIEASSTSTTE